MKVMNRDLLSQNFTRRLSTHENTRDIYAEKLMAQGVIDEDYVKKLEEEYKAQLEENLEDSRKEENY